MESFPTSYLSHDTDINMEVGKMWSTLRWMCTIFRVEFFLYFPPRHRQFMFECWWFREKILHRQIEAKLMDGKRQAKRMIWILLFLLLLFKILLCNLTTFLCLTWFGISIRIIECSVRRATRTRSALTKWGMMSKSRIRQNNKIKMENKIGRNMRMLSKRLHSIQVKWIKLISKTTAPESLSRDVPILLLTF
jgi:hypothetical protein